MRAIWRNKIHKTKHTIKHQNKPLLELMKSTRASRLFQRTLGSSCRCFSTSSAAVDAADASKLCWLDLRGSGLSMLERLSLEEALLRHDDRNWALVGTHEPFPHKYLRKIEQQQQQQQYDDDDDDDYSNDYNPDCMIIMGIGGKPEKLLNIPLVKKDNVMVVKRFSGGGTVVLDGNSIWTTLICRTEDKIVSPYPREIMEWTAESIFGPMFDKLQQQQQQQQQNLSDQRQTLALDTKSCSATENLGRLKMVPKTITTTKTTTKTKTTTPANLPRFALRENDYVFGDRKMGGNAQSIIKEGWLHHTSFLWEYDPDNMEYLSLPEKRPEYRGNRSHSDFLTPLASHFGHGRKGKFYECLLEACQESFPIVEKMMLSDVVQQVVDEKLGGMDEWLERNRTRIVTDF